LATAGSKSALWNLSILSPSVVKPSGNKPTQSPSASAARTLSLMRVVSRHCSERMKIVPLAWASQPATGQSRISPFAMKRVGRTLERTKISSHET